MITSNNWSLSYPGSGYVVGIAMQSLPSDLTTLCASRRAPVTSPSCILNPWLAINCRTMNLSFNEIVGACVCPSRINENKSGPLSPRAVHLALTMSWPASSTFGVRTNHDGTILSANCCRTCRDSGNGNALKAFLLWIITLSTSFWRPSNSFCSQGCSFHLGSFKLISFRPPWAANKKHHRNLGHRTGQNLLHLFLFGWMHWQAHSRRRRISKWDSLWSAHHHWIWIPNHLI